MIPGNNWDPGIDRLRKMMIGGQGQPQQSYMPQTPFQPSALPSAPEPSGDGGGGIADILGPLMGAMGAMGPGLDPSQGQIPGVRDPMSGMEEEHMFNTQPASTSLQIDPLKMLMLMGRGGR